MCDRDERETLMSHFVHCYPRATAYLVVVTTLILLLAILDAAGVL